MMASASPDKRMTRRMQKDEPPSPAKATRSTKPTIEEPLALPKSPTKRKPPASRAEPLPKKAAAVTVSVKKLNLDGNDPQVEKPQRDSPAKQIPQQNNEVVVVGEKKSTPETSSSGRSAGGLAPTTKAKEVAIKKGMYKKTSEKLKNEENEIKRGSLVVSQMSEDDIQTLLDKICTQCPALDNKSHEFRFANLKWSQVTFKSFSEEDCRAAWRYLRVATRKVRIMTELVAEVKSALEADVSAFKQKLLDALPNFPQNKRHSSPFALFLKQSWDSRSPEEKKEFATFFVFQIEMKKVFDGMNEEEKKVWEQNLEEEKIQYHRQIEQYFDKHPEFGRFRTFYNDITTKENNSRRMKKIARTEGERRKSKDGNGNGKSSKKPSLYTISQQFPDAPQLPMNSMALFMQTRLDQLDPADVEDNLAEYKQKYSRKWQKLSDRKKGKWIDKCINKCEEYRVAVEDYCKIHPSYRPPSFKIIQRVSKTEIGIWEKYKERPTRPPFTINELIQNQMKDEEGDKYASYTPTQLKQIADKKWKELSACDQQFYRMHFQKLVLMYRKNIKEFYEGVPEIIKPNVYATIPKKFITEIQPPQLQNNNNNHAKADDDDGESNDADGATAKKKPKSCEYIEDSSSSSVDFNPPMDPFELDYDFPLPKIEAHSSERKPRMEMEDEPVKKKKKKKHRQEEEQEEETYVTGIPSHYSDLEKEAGHSSPKRKKKKKKSRHSDDEEPGPSFSSFAAADWNPHSQSSSDDDSSEFSSMEKRREKDYRDKAISKFEKKKRHRQGF